MNRSKETSPATDGKEQDRQRDSGTESIEIELDDKQLRAMAPLAGQNERSLDDDVPPSRDLIDTATNLELSQSLDDLRSLSWPGLKPGTIRKPDK